MRRKNSKCAFDGILSANTFYTSVLSKAKEIEECTSTVTLLLSTSYSLITFTFKLQRPDANLSSSFTTLPKASSSSVLVEGLTTELTCCLFLLFVYNGLLLCPDEKPGLDNGPSNCKISVSFCSITPSNCITC